jgi:uncharacterized membrane protein
MQIALIVTLVLHLLSGVFWAGSTFTLARNGAVSTDRLFRPQMGAAAVALITGGILWHLLHPSGFGAQETILAIGAIAALLAAAVQGVLCGPGLRRLASAGGTHVTLQQERIVIGHRVAGGFLALTVICMAAARFL